MARREIRSKVRIGRGAEGLGAHSEGQDPVPRRSYNGITAPSRRRRFPVDQAQLSVIG